MDSLEKIFRTLAVGPRLGIGNIIRVLAYRAAFTTKLIRRVPRLPPRPCGPFFSFPSEGSGTPAVFEGRLFGWRLERQGAPPDWHSSPFRPGPPISSSIDWGEALRQIPADADIKEYWEWSRFYWVPALVRRAALGDDSAGPQLETWLDDWVVANPAFRGLQWSCGQEAAIRVLHILQASLFCNQVIDPPPALLWLVRVHLERIAPTLHYAIGQDNNHGSSEAAALFAGGAWLQKYGDEQGERWYRTGRKWLEDRAFRLFQADGSSNQYSVTYHRVVLETFSFVELWRDALQLDTFPLKMRARIGEAAKWLRNLVDPRGGDAPNLGSNDGSHILALSEEDYRDFRPTVELAAALFLDRSSYGPGEIGDRLNAYHIERRREALPALSSLTYNQAGLHILRRGQTVAYLRYPRFSYRPAQADALHLDLWVDGVNWLRDAGSYSYASSEHAYFSDVAAHNTVQFDNREQMPRIGRFLYGAWLQAHDVEEVTSSGEGVRAAAAYRDFKGAVHRRSVDLSSAGLVCRDDLSGTAEKAVLRWRLRPGDWSLENGTVRCGSFRLAVETDDPAAKLCVTEGWESRYYLQKEALPVLEVHTSVPARIITRVTF